MDIYGRYPRENVFDKHIASSDVHEWSVRSTLPTPTRNVCNSSLAYVLNNTEQLFRCGLSTLCFVETTALPFNIVSPTRTRSRLTLTPSVLLPKAFSHRVVCMFVTSVACTLLSNRFFLFLSQSIDSLSHWCRQSWKAPPSNQQ